MMFAILAALQAAQATPPPRAAVSASQVAEVRTADGRLVARALVFAAGDRPVQVRIQAAGLAPGSYGAHIHAVGRCEGPDFESAGPHWNPAGRQHGSLNPQGPHLGDLPNLEVDGEGHGRVEDEITAAVLQGEAHAVFDADGSAVVIHAAPDDYRTDPAGNSGARIACAVLTLPTP